MAFPGPIPEWLEKNKAYAANYEKPPEFTQMMAHQKKAGDGTFILTCIDPRCTPENFFGPKVFGPVYRNGGGRATDDAVRSITLLRTLIDLKNVVVIHHTDCGVMLTSEQELIRDVKERTPGAAAEADDMKFKTFTSEGYEEAIKEDVMVLREAKALAGMKIFGFSLDVTTGLVTHVDV